MLAVIDDVCRPRAFASLKTSVEVNCAREDARATRDARDDDLSALTRANWMPHRASPLCAIEAYIASIVSACAEASREDASTLAGAEWWIQDVASDEEPKRYHFDCDVAYDGVGSIKTYPRMASVTYITTGGGATVVFAQKPSKVAIGELEPRAPGRVAACAPRANRLMVFEGDSWHGVLRAREEEEFQGQRVTLLVNWWDAKPSGAREFPREYAEAYDEEAFASAFGARREVMNVDVRRASYANDAHAWEDQRAPDDAAAIDVCTFVYDGEDDGAGDVG